MVTTCYLPLNKAAPKERGDVLVEFNRFEVGHDGRGGLMPIRCLIRGQYKFVINLHSEDELYDHAVDPPMSAPTSSKTPTMPKSAMSSIRPY